MINFVRRGRREAFFPRSEVQLFRLFLHFFAALPIYGFFVLLFRLRKRREKRIQYLRPPGDLSELTLSGTSIA